MLVLKALLDKGVTINELATLIHVLARENESNGLISNPETMLEALGALALKINNESTISYE